MKKRVLAAVLWFFAAAYIWNMIALMIGLSSIPGLVLGVLAAGLFAVDPLHRIWTVTGPETQTA